MSLVFSRWNDLSDYDKEQLKESFIGCLATRYHRRFFQQLPPDRLIYEIWFQQFVVIEWQYQIFKSRPHGRNDEN